MNPFIVWNVVVYPALALGLSAASLFFQKPEVMYVLLALCVYLSAQFVYRIATATD